MANVSSANVEICTTKEVEAALTAFIEHTSGNYGLLEDFEVDHDGDQVSFSGIADGRWSYSNNLTGLLDPVNGGPPAWIDDEASEAVWHALVSALGASGFALVIEYTDAESGCQHLASGGAALEVTDDGEVVFTIQEDSYEWTINNFMTLRGESEYDAISYVYNWEVADVFTDFDANHHVKGETDVFKLELERCDLRDALLKGTDCDLEDCEDIATALLPYLS